VKTSVLKNAFYRVGLAAGNFNAKVGREDIFKQTTANESLHEISNNNGFRVVHFATSKNLIVRSKMFPHCNINKFTWASPEGKMHNPIDHILLARRRHSCIPDARLFSAVDCDIGHYLVVAKASEKLVVSK
jgi:hypothetical protein